ncbi:unnamed protein product [Tuber melanosporum]|uniref:(Perigord truffle) hypothetical protein n=1 Tax=Tuber melanosporum (strain Mel28) TaxID=656061 RepID=D5GFA0_TUBMM|nr:uncharacterized protein GSTUM_00006795001 [Tuber melanosporum]CAZ83193.1 unnamed protein product [Tuber melanosporum]
MSGDTTPILSPRSTPTKQDSQNVSPHTLPMTPPSPAFTFTPGELGYVSSDTSSDSSARSSLARTDLGGPRRRGFMRPQGTEFSTSARSRESVMALGSIAHLQYFFAKTGLLDGKGAGLQTKKSSNSLKVDTRAQGIPQDSTYSSLRSSPELFMPMEADFFSESPSELDDFAFDESVMLPPTTSTYNPQTKHIPPTPNPQVLRERLRGALAVTKSAWLQSFAIPGGPARKEKVEGEEDLAPLPPGFSELHGNELVELATSAIRAAKAYYYTTDTSLLSTLDDRSLREGFLTTLDALKRLAQRKFDGGVKPEERNAVVKWIDSVELSLAAEENAIADMRKKGREWLEGSWEGREMDRCHLFLTYFDSSPSPLPPFVPTEPATPLPTPFLLSLRSGLRLILIHNAVVRRSKRPFGQIPNYHKEFSKPYRSAENLRFWKKAAEIRWELRLKFDVTSVVNGTEDGWQGFQRDIRYWCEKVLEEIRTDWEVGDVASGGEEREEGRVRQTRSGTLESLNVEIGGYIS